MTDIFQQNVHQNRQDFGARKVQRDGMRVDQLCGVVMDHIGKSKEIKFRSKRNEETLLVCSNLYKRVSSDQIISKEELTNLLETLRSVSNALAAGELKSQNILLSSNLLILSVVTTIDHAINKADYLQVLEKALETPWRKKSTVSFLTVFRTLSVIEDSTERRMIPDDAVLACLKSGYLFQGLLFELLDNKYLLEESLHEQILLQLSHFMGLLSKSF